MLPPGTRVGEWRLVAPAGAGGTGRHDRAERANANFKTPAVLSIRTSNDARLVERLAPGIRLLARLDPQHRPALAMGRLSDGHD